MYAYLCILWVRQAKRRPKSQDLAHIVGSQQEQVDQIETQMEQSKANAQQGLGHIQKANEKASQAQCSIS